MKYGMFTGLLIFFFGSVCAQQEDSLFIRALADEILANGTCYNNLHVLTKEVGGRLSGSPQTYKAEAWGQKALKDAGAPKVWLQECKIPHWVRGGKDEASASSKGKKMNLDILALGNSVGTGPKGISAPVVLINSFDELEKRKDELKGKIVFYNYKFNDKFIKTFMAYGDAVRYRGQGPGRAAKYGALAVLVRSMSNSTDNNPHTGATVYNDSFPKIPAAAIGLRDADQLATLMGNSKDVTVFLKTNGKMLPDTIAHNVIGEWTGTQFPDQIITIGGHLDSWDPAEGAHDDGTGCVQSIEVLRSLKTVGYQPKHTIRIVLFANEENGARGGAKYAEEAKAKNEKHILAMESDEGGFTPRGFGLSVKDDQFMKLRTWAPLFWPYGVFEWNRGGGGTDISPLMTNLGTPLAGFQPDPQRYFDIHHSRGDVFEAVNKRELELGAVNMAALIYLVDKYGL